MEIDNDHLLVKSENTSLTVYLDSQLEKFLNLNSYELNRFFIYIVRDIIGLNQYVTYA